MEIEEALPGAGLQQLRNRARLLGELRGFFEKRQVLEVETPLLSQAGNSDPGLQQFQTRCGRWLRTSPEYAMKRLLAAGTGDCYELGRVFRAGETGRLHNPEFTLLEWYRVGWHFEQLMDEVVALVRHCGSAFEHHWKVRKLTYRDWLEEATGIDALHAGTDEIRGVLEAAGHSTAGLDGMDRDGWLDVLITHCVQPAMAADTLTLVYLYPASQAALAQLHDPDPRLAERFEAYLGPVELANGYQELTDASEQRARFEAENRRRRASGLSTVPLDEHLLAALEQGLPSCTGVALGVDRLQLALGDASHLAEVTALPWDRA